MLAGNRHPDRAPMVLLALILAAAANLALSATSQPPMSYAGGAEVATRFPAYATRITSAARAAFLGGDQWAHVAGILAVVVGAALVSLVSARRDEERCVLAGYHATDTMTAHASMTTVPA